MPTALTSIKAQRAALSKLAREIDHHHQHAQHAVQSAFEHARQAGERLAEAKAMLGHGQWLPWLRANCGLSARTAQSYMQLAKGLPNTQTSAHLTSVSKALELVRAKPDPVRYYHEDVPQPETVTVQYWERETVLPAVVVPRYVEAEEEEAHHSRGVRMIEPPLMAVHHSSETSEHYTPRVIIDVVIAFMGGIDLDPCSNPGEPIVPAAKHYTEEDDGLAQEWCGRVYMNPPYGTVIEAWVRKLQSEYIAGNVTQAIALVPSRTDTVWFRALRDYPACFIAGRLTFVGNDASAPFPSAVFYLGDDPDAFEAAFDGLGDVWVRRSAPRPIRRLWIRPGQR
jgi:DNA N-6-adenine-methyltransferase (Dam)/Protein of unknown function (DUF3102)